MITTTLKAIRKSGPCGLRPDEDGTLTGYLKLKEFLGKDFADDAPLKFSVIAESNGITDAAWCIRYLEGEHLTAMVAFAADMAESVLPIWEDWAKVNAPEHLDAPRKSIEAARNGSPDAAACAARAADAARAARAAYYSDTAEAARAACAAEAAARAAYAFARAARASDIAADAAACAADAAACAADAAACASDTAAYAAYRAADAAYAAAYAADAAGNNAIKKTQLELLKKHFS